MILFSSNKTIYLSLFVEIGSHSRKPELFLNITIVSYMALSKFSDPSGHRRLKKTTTSCDQTRRRQDILQKKCDLRRPIYVVLNTSTLRRLEDVWFTLSWRCLIYDVLKTSDLRHLEDIWFRSLWRRPIYDVWKMFNLQRLEDVCKATPL